MYRRRRRSRLPIAGLLVVLCVSAEVAVGGASADDVVYDEEVQVLRSQEMTYPRLGASARIHGIVVVKLTLDDDGRVRSAEPLSGPKVLVEPSVANARLWAFRPTRSKAIILLYDFRLDDAMCGSVVSFYTFQAPNVSVIRACHEPLNP